MKLRRLGNSGLQVSVVGLGCNNFGRMELDATRAVIHKALDAGITLFDTADVYAPGKPGSSEEQMGEVLGARRQDIVLATKFGMQMDQAGIKKGGSRRYIMAAVEDSLRRLKTDWIDLYQFHRPDADTPVEETLRALDDLVRQGKVRYIGASNMPAWQVVEAQWTAKELRLGHFVSCQDEYSLLARDIVERELSAAAQKYGLGILPFFPLASGALTGKYRRNQAKPAGSRLSAQSPLSARFLSEANLDIVDKLAQFSEKRGHTILELAFSWLLARPQVSSVIAGATKPEQIEANARAADWVLTAEEIAEVDKITKTG
ncbi:MAG TPA: aldo/keto reductase [Stellaceae bacterium]|nr:aldo/keto reductase [Stellaceae bacterium]